MISDVEHLFMCLLANVNFMIISEISQHHLGMSLGSSLKLNCASLQTKPILPCQGRATPPPLPTTTAIIVERRRERKREEEEKEGPPALTKNFLSARHVLSTLHALSH